MKQGELAELVVLDKSKQIFESICKFVPGGVHSNVRCIDPHPIYFSRAKGSRIWDVDGNEYTDYCVNYGTCILGHAHPRVVSAVREQLEIGLTCGVETELAAKVAKKVADIIPCAENVRFSNTGTEAMMHAVRIARGYTKKSKIIKVEGGNHGWCDDLLVSLKNFNPNQAGPRDRPTPVPASEGVRKNVIEDTIVVPYNDAASTEKIIKENRNDVAALIIEPVLFSLGCVLPKEGYLKAIRDITLEMGVVLIFDEIITGFRLAPGGAQEFYDVTPDMAVFGKAIANGFPLSVVTGAEDLINVSAPKTHRVGYGGTFNGHQISMAAASASLEELTSGKVQTHLANFTKELQRTFNSTVNELGIDAKLQGIGGEFQVYFTDHDIEDYRTAYTANKAAFTSFQEKLFNMGFYFLPSYLFHHGISFAHDEKDLRRLSKGMRTALDEL